MSFYKLEKVSNFEFSIWLRKTFENSKFDRQDIEDILKRSDFLIYKEEKKVSNFWLRLTIIPLLFMYILLFIFLPINFIISGKWSYSENFIFWFKNWRKSLNL
jgi:hypothetical protein